MEPEGSLSKSHGAGLPWWRSGWESACQCSRHRFEPWSRRIPHAAERLGPWATITEPACLEPVLRNKRGHDSERPAHCDEEWPPLAATRESPHTETKTQQSHKKTKKKNKKNTHSLKKKKKSWSKKSGQHTYSKSFYNVNDPDPTSLFCDSVLRKEPLSLLGWVVPFCSWRELSIMAFLYPMRWWIMTHTQPVMVTGQSKWTCDFHQDRDAL